jgi:hypothetical protein
MNAREALLPCSFCGSTDNFHVFRAAQEPKS